MLLMLAIFLENVFHLLENVPTQLLQMELLAMILTCVLLWITVLMVFAASVCHQDGVCQPSTGNCAYALVADNTSCSDSNPCTLDDYCLAGYCVGTPKTCFAPNSCHDDGVCDPDTGSCSIVYKANGTACSDSNACTLNDACYLGTCVPGTQKPCEALDQCHDVGVCDTLTGYCSNPYKANGTACDDGNLCTSNDQCVAGVTPQPSLALLLINAILMEYVFQLLENVPILFPPTTFHVMTAIFAL